MVVDLEDLRKEHEIALAETEAARHEWKRSQAELERYRSEIVPKLREEFSYKNIHQVPRVTKVVVNVGVGEATQNPKLLERAVEELGQITGQKANVRRARKSVSNFKLREGQAIGAMVTLRGIRCWEFLDRLLNVALPRVRDFKGVSPKSFDGRSNYTIAPSSEECVELQAA